MSIETMMTLGVAGVIFVSALLILGALTLITRLSMLILRPTARGTTTMVRRHAPTVAAVAAAWTDRLETYIDEQAGPATRAALARSAERVATDYREKLVPAVRDRIVPTARESLTEAREKALPAVREWFTGSDDLHPALTPARHRHRRA